jgi:hypothetical protein
VDEFYYKDKKKTSLESFHQIQNVLTLKTIKNGLLYQMPFQNRYVLNKLDNLNQDCL